MDNHIQEIAQRICELREILGISIEEMARICEVSVEDYINAESGKSDFSFSFLHQCANAFNVDVTELISGEAPKLSGYSIVRNGEGLPLERRKGFKYQHMASYFKNKMSEPFVVVAKHDKNAEHLPIPLSRHSGEEFNYVLEGKLKIKIDGHTEILNPGDSIYYNSTQPHGMIAIDDDCKFIAVVIDQKGEALKYDGLIKEKTDKKVTGLKKDTDFVYNQFIEVSEDENGILTDIKFKPTSNFNFGFDVVDTAAEKNPNKTAMIWVSNDDKEITFTFDDIKKYSNKAANYFVSQGIKKGDRVMLVLKRNYQFWFAIVALHKIGAIVIPATNLLTKKDFIYRYNAAGVSAIVCTAEGEVSDHALDACTECSEVKVKIMANGVKDGWQDFDNEIEKFSDIFNRPTGEADVTNDDIMLMYFTSGTTGYPKIAAHSFTYPLGHFITAKYWHNVDPEGLHFTIADTGWGKAVWGKLYGQWLCEAAVFTYDFDKFIPDNILRKFEKHKITSFCAPPTIYRFLIQEDLAKYDLSALKYCTIAGEALNPEVYSKFLNLTGIKLMEGFGQTETTLTVLNLVGTNPKPGSMGKPCPAYDVDLINAEGKSAKTGEIGEIVVRTDKRKPCGLYLGYYKDPEKTKEAWNNDIYYTGDMAWRDEDGYFWYVSRTDDVIKSSGYRIGPFEIESVLMEHPAVLECAVTGVPDPLRGQAVKATIVLTKNYTPSEELKKEIQNYVKRVTAPYKYPRIVDFVDELPKTISGKIRRVEIRNTDQNKR